jgi:gliding motility-associated-like protein
MKKLYYHYLTVCYLFLILLGSAFNANAQVIVPFKERTSSYTPTTKTYHVKGNFTMMGNTNLTLQNYSETETNGTNSMVFVDVDNDADTFNSSSSTLVLPTDSGTNLDCSKVIFAGLYWTGRTTGEGYSPNPISVTKNSVTKTLDKHNILFKGPSSNAYTSITANEIYFPTNANNNIYTAYTEVTDYVKTNGVGEYFAADIATIEGGSNFDNVGRYAGWALIVVYENSSMKNRDITIFDGHAFVLNQVTENYTIPVSGFNAVASGPVGIKIGIIAGEGDINYDGDYFQIQKLSSNDYLSLNHSGNTTNNFFNSSIQTGGNARNPNLKNNTGIDISMFNLPNNAKDIITNNQTSTNFKYGSNVDTYAIFAIAMAVDAYVPDIQGALTSTTINGTPSDAGPYTVLPGQELEYKLQIKNRGSEAIQNTKVTIPIPYNATFVPGSLIKTINFTPAPTPNSLTYEPTIGANGSIVWDLGNLPLPADSDTVLAELSFKLKSTEDCALLKNSNCSNIIAVNGSLNGTGINSNVAVTNKPFILGYTTGGSCSGNEITAPLQTTINTTNFIDANCQATPPVIAFTFCNSASTIPITDVTGSFPMGATFYDAYPIVAGTTTQYTINNPFPATVGTKTYYAIPAGANGGCYFEFTITVQSITSMPTVNGAVNYCIGDVAVPLTATPTNPNYTLYYYLTNTSSAQQSITPPTDTVGQFTYYVAEGITNACIGPKKPITVNINAKPDVIITTPIPICLPATTLNLTATEITAGSSPDLIFTYWTDANATIAYTTPAAAIPGTYYIKGTNTSGCYDIKPVVISKSTVVLTEVLASHVNVNCYGQTTGSIVVDNASGGISPYSYSWKKDGLIYNSTSQDLTNLAAGSYEVTATDTNGCSGSLIVVITQPSAALTAAIASKTDVNCKGEATGSATASASGGTASYSYSWNTNPVQTSASAINLTAGTYIVTVTDSKGCTDTEQVIIEEPQLALTATTSQTNVVCGGGNTGSATVTVSGGTSQYSYLWSPSGGTAATATGLAAGTYSVTVTDAKQCSVTESVIILDGDAVKPVIDALPATSTINCPALPVFAQATASDENGTISSLTFVDSVTAGNCAGSYSTTRTWKAKDACGNISVPVSQTIIVQDITAPTWTTPTASLNQTIECSNTQALASAQALFPTAADLCDVDVSNIVKVSGSFVSSPTCSNAGTYTNTWTAKDDCGNTSDTFTQVITIQDTTAPIFTGNLPQNITVSCDAVPEPAEIEASDNCSQNLPIVFSEIKSGIQNQCSSNYILTRKWTTSDCSGNLISYTQIIKVEDTTPPTGTAPADIANLQNIADIPVGNPSDIKDAADNCSANVTITVSDSNNGGSGCDGNAFILTRTYTLTDCAGNKTELKQTFTVENKVAVSAVASNITCFGKNDGSILVTNSPGSTVVITNEKNQVVGNTNLPAGTYTITATSSVNSGNQTCNATTTVTITEPNYTIKVSGQVINVDTHLPIANVPVTLIPQGTTGGPILFRLTGADGMYSFSGMAAGSYLVQVQDANLNSAYQLYPVDSSLFFTTLEDCKLQVHNFVYGKSNLPVLGDYVWYDTNGNGIQDEWYDANNDGIVTKNIPDNQGAIDYSKWEWIDFNGDGSYTGPQNTGELNAGGFGNALSSNVIIDGPKGYHEEVIVGIQGYWRNRPETTNPYGQYTIKLVRDVNLDAVAAALGATGLVKVLPSLNDKKITSKTNKAQLHTVCQTTTVGAYIVNVTPQDLVHLDIDFGVNCKQYQDIVANDDTAGPIAGVNHTTTNVLNVLVNDTIEGVVVKASDVIITTVTPNPFLQLNPDGSVDVLPDAPVGTLTMVYQICEADQTSNCDTATVTVTIEAPVMTVTATPICVNDVPYIDYVVTAVNFTPVDGVTIAWAGSNNNVITTMNNLPLSGRVLWPGAVVDQAGNGIDWPGWVFQNNKWIQAADGFETLRPTATLTITVNPSQTIVVNYPPADPYCTARPTFAIVANDDTAGPINGNTGGTNVVNVFTNDTLNGNAVNPADVTLTTVTPDPTGALTLNPDGSVNVAPNTPTGTYILTYQICEKADFGNCDTATVTITVVNTPPPPPVVNAVADTYNVSCNGFGNVGNVLSNDKIDLGPALIELLNFTLLPSTQGNAGITVDASGNVTVASTTPPGTYNYDYQICLKNYPAVCTTKTITITVLPNVTNITSEACADDSTLIDLLTLLPENTPRNGTWVDTNSTNALQGAILNPFGLALGNYVFEYKIADQNCPRTVLLSMEINDDCKVLPCGNVVVHNAMSPNGDGMNDVFTIDSIDDITCYPENTVEIYNRWGILVFETANYNNTTNVFDGTSRGRTTFNKSEGLPTDTYFYIVNYKSLDGNNVLQSNKKDGYLYLSK